MKNTVSFLHKKIEDKSILWSAPENQYLVLENTTATAVKKLYNGESVTAISKDISAKLSLPIKECTAFVLELQQRFITPVKQEGLQKSKNLKNITVPEFLAVQKFYKINDTVIRVSFKSEAACFLVHPKFEHLEVPQTKYNTCFKVFIEESSIFLAVNDTIIDSWTTDKIHFFQGKFSMELIQKIHKKEEDKWMGVFHASAVSNGKKAMLFLGDSGNGKSTSLALLQANGFNCIADDFVPVAIENQEVYRFPAGISVKKNSLETLLPFYPELKDATEFDFKDLHKIVRYIKPNNTDVSPHLPCSDLVFIKYTKNVATSCNKISKIDAFQQLVPDSWLSPRKENAQVFLDWFEHLNCYQLIYSNTDQMVAEVSKLFTDGL
ncbi:MAG: hypothetical protein ACI9R6_001051 [Saprospiraceae bacterium]